MLILLETPGAGMKTDDPVSRDNPTGTARNLLRFSAAAGLQREATLLWNSVPWMVHAPGARNRPLRRGELREEIGMPPGLLSLPPRLTAVGRRARRSRSCAPIGPACA